MTRRILLVALIALLIVAFFALDLGRFLSLDYLQDQRASFLAFYADNRLVTLLVFFVVYVAVTGASLPGALVLTLAAGALFGLVTGTILVSFASSIGATLAFLLSRTVLGDWVQRRYGQSLAAFNQGVARDGAFYLFTLRMVPLFPFFVINLLMGLTRLPTVTFYWVSQLGMLAGTVVFVFAGTQLANLTSPGDILSPGLIVAFSLLGLLPLVARMVVRKVAERKAYAGWERPTAFDNNLIVIGGGSGGLISALIAATVKAKVTLIERREMGGDCLNTGCVPSKTLIKSARIAHEISRADRYGLDVAPPKVDFAAVMERVQAAISKIEPKDSMERYRSLGVECIAGEARFIDPWTVEVNGERHSARAIIIATGGTPFIPPIPGLEDVNYVTSDTFWAVREQPRRVVVLGGGPIGCELSQSLLRLGSEVTLVDRGERVLRKEDPEVGAFVGERFVAEGMKLLMGHTAVEAVAGSDGDSLRVADAEGNEQELPFDLLLVAVGRRAVVSGLDPDKVGVKLDDRGQLDLDEYLATSYPHIYACGDVAGNFQFTHTASHEAWFAAVNALFGDFWRFRVKHDVVPWATYIEPEVATVGLTEQAAAAKGLAYEVTRYELDDLDRAIAEGEDQGWIKILTAADSDRILGATIVGHHAGELISEYVNAMTHGQGLKKLMAPIHIYPTMMEGNKLAVGQWRRARAPHELLAWVGKFHAWMRA